MSDYTYDPAVDELGSLRALIAELTEQTKVIEAELKAQGDGVYQGDLFRTVVTTVTGKRVDWKAIAAKLEPSSQLVTAHTKATSSVRLSAPCALLKDAA